MKNVLIFVLSIICISNGQIKIAGEQDGVYDSAVYVVQTDLIVPAGKILEFLSGSEIRVMPYTGIKAYGNLKMKNVKVVSYDSVNGFWNGIDVAQKGSIDFENIQFSRSILGIDVPDSTAIKSFKNVVFTSNKISLKIGESPIFIREGMPFSIEPLQIIPSIKESHQLIVNPTLPEPRRTAPSFKTMRWVASIAAFSCAAACIFCAVESKSYYDKYNASEKNKDIQSFKIQSQKYKNIAIGTGIGAGVLGAGVIFSILF